MPLKAYLAAVLGLSIVAVPVPLSAQPSPADAIRLAQASPKADADEDDDKDDRGKSRRPERGQKNDDSAKGAERGASQKDKGKAAGKDAAPKQDAAGAEKAKAEAAKAAGDAAEKSKQETTRKAAPEQPPAKQQTQQRNQQPPQQQSRDRDDDRSAPKSVKSRDDNRRGGDDDDDRRGPSFSRDDDRRDSPGARDREDDRRGPSEARDRDDDRDDRRPNFSRERNRDDDEQSLSRARERERDRTPAQELSRTQIRGDRPTEIDGGRRTLRQEGDRIVIRSDDFDRLRYSRDGRGNQRVERLPNGHVRTIVVYPDGSQIVTVTGSRGEILHRSRRDPRGREIVLIREVQRPPVARIDLGPLRLSIPREQYIVDSRRASAHDMRAALIAPPVERVERVYSLEEVRRFERIRDKMRRIDISSITFDTDSALITPDQAGALEELATIIRDLIERNPGEVFMIEGHTDLVGSPVYNLALSDRRAEAVAIALSDYFAIPPENLVTQGYGESFPKIPTELAERENRRVAVRRITPLVAGN